MAGRTLSPGLVHEAELMVRSLLDDLAEIPGIEVFTSRDPRLPPIPSAELLTPVGGEAPLDLYRRGLARADAVWPIAPETASSLERLGRMALTQDRVLLGTHPDTVRLTASKRWTTAHLAASGIPAVPTFESAAKVPDLPGRWVVKPDDGAGAEDTQVVESASEARALLERRGEGQVAQPWIEGRALSISLLCAAGKARLLTCNRQHISIAEGRVSLAGISVNAESALAPLLFRLAGEIAAAIPLLWGHIGVDLILSDTGPVVLEINPRLTTSYCGLRRSLGENPARWVFDLLRTGHLPATPSSESGKTVELNLEAAHAG